HSKFAGSSGHFGVSRPRNTFIRRRGRNLPPERGRRHDLEDKFLFYFFGGVAFYGQMQSSACFYGRKHLPNPEKTAFWQKKTASTHHLAKRDGFDFQISLFSRVNEPPGRAGQRAQP
ncbi:MAG: hypothetical protein J5968_00455, partial [Oscillospiraceae bacterium]|nr:hypothetical protein [Oscillospiraceae bacterium]